MAEDFDENARVIVAAILDAHRVRPVDLARRLDIDPSKVSRRLNGKNAFTAAELYRIVEIFGLSPGIFQHPASELTAMLEELRTAVEQNRVAVLENLRRIRYFPLLEGAVAPPLFDVDRFELTWESRADLAAAP